MSKDLENIPQYTVHMIFSGAGFGGSGKRFFFLARILASESRKFFIYSTDETIDRLHSGIRERKNPNVYFFSIGSWADSQANRDKCVKKEIVKNYKTGDIIHVAGSHPLFLSPKYFVLYSHIGVHLPFSSKISCIVKAIKRTRGLGSSESYNHIFEIHESSDKLSPTKLLDKIKSITEDFRSWVAIMSSSHVDVLNPRNYLIIKKFRIITSASCTVGLSPHFPVEIKSSRRNKIVFLGRIEKQKGIDFFLGALSETDRILAAKNLEAEVHIVGEGSFSSTVDSFLKDRSFSQIKVFSYWSDEVHIVLSDAKVFVSLQRYSNYPSRALVEAMCHGVLPVISNTGDSKLMVPKHYPFLFEEEALQQKLAPCLADILSMPSNEYLNLSEDICKFVSFRCAPRRQSRYYDLLYGKLHHRQEY